MFNVEITRQGTINKNLEKVQEVLYNKIEENLTSIGNTKVKEAVEKSTFQNVTYNLRASMGARLYKENTVIKQIRSGIQPIIKTQSYIYNLEANLRDTYMQIEQVRNKEALFSLIVYAGMEYGRKVSARKKLVIPPLSHENDKKRVKRGLKNALRGISFGNG
jgi:hypothetical protein